MIDAGRVTINGKIPEMGTKVLPGDDVESTTSQYVQKKADLHCS
ncbi:hypothetical protein O9929_04370 [Vibrio lentus]|nr:hypothetical protein [Vibrio lentus]